MFVNHDHASGFGDLIESFTGLFHSTDCCHHVTMPQVASRLEHDKEQIDLFFWIDGKTSTVQGFFFNRDTVPNYLNQLCALLYKNPTAINFWMSLSLNSAEQGPIDDGTIVGR